MGAPPRDWCPLLGEVLDLPLLNLTLAGLPLSFLCNSYKYTIQWNTQIGQQLCYIELWSGDISPYFILSDLTEKNNLIMIYAIIFSDFTRMPEMKQHLRKIGHYLLSVAALMYISLSVLKGLLYQLEEDNLNVERRASVQSRVAMAPSDEHLQNALKSDSRDGRDWIYQRSNEKIETGDNHQSIKPHSISGGHRKLFIKDMESVIIHKSQENISRSLDATLFPHIIENQPYMCSESEDVPKGTYLLVMVHSYPAHKERRHAIRETWARIVRNYDNAAHVSLLFVLGISIRDKDNTKVKTEVKLYRDIIMGNFSDTYQTLSTKSMFSLRWATTYCAEAKFILKTDDDVYLNISRLLTELQEFHGPKPLLMGYRYNQAPVMRHGQWKVDFNQFAADSFPPYCSGVAYVMSSSTLWSLLNSYVQLKQKSILQIEDVFTTGVLANASGITCTHNERFPSWITSPSISNLKRLLQNKVLGIHGVTYTSIYNIQRMIEQCSECYSSYKSLKLWFMKLGKIPLSSW